MTRIQTSQQAYAIKAYSLLKVKPRKLSQLMRLLKISANYVRKVLGQVRADGHTVRCEGSGVKGDPLYWMDEAEAHRYRMRGVDGLI